MIVGWLMIGLECGWMIMIGFWVDLVEVVLGFWFVG